MYYRKTLRISIVFVYLIIVAGAVVRMTGSGMGCPDWPQCFGYLIPPTTAAEIEWQPQYDYEEGQIIIVNESLRIAPSDFVSGPVFNEANWQTYDKHDYAKFNVWNTWIEYINRLVTALAGIPMLLMFIFSFWYWKGKPGLIFASFLVLPLMGFQAWLGKLVVDSNLFPVKITIHMLAALVILALLLYLWYRYQLNERAQERSSLLPRHFVFNAKFRNLMVVAVILTLVQVALGTQVRQYVDERVAAVGYDARSQWLNPVTLWFYIHRSFSIIITLLALYLYWLDRKKVLGHQPMLKWVLIFLGIEVLTGIAMYYVDFPFGTQPIHLVLATLLFGAQFSILLRSRKVNASIPLHRL
ncbi:MAG: COX15/CtaA family protein [Dokdonia sp.]|jgi:cytochrome c oxidase assembly protein subunit 15